MTNKRRKINVASCTMADDERRELLSCIDANWITSGPKVQEFERLFAEFCGTKHAVAANNGTSALHLALIAAGVRPGTEVIVPDLTYVASANAVMYCGAKPVFCDVLPDTWCMDPHDMESRLTERTRAIMPVHLYGHPCDMNVLRDIAARRNIALVEDAAEAHGSEVDGKRVGGLGDVGSFSFYGNKMITTGEGGICTTDTDTMAETMQLYRGQGVDPCKRYWHKVVGYNYRMTDLQGAVGCAQMRRLPGAIEHNRAIAGIYRDKLAGSGLLLPVEKDWAKNVYWLYSVIVPDMSDRDRDRIIEMLGGEGIETRPFFYPLHQLPPYVSAGADEEFPVAVRLARGGISLPVHDDVTCEDAAYVADQLLALV